MPSRHCSRPAALRRRATLWRFTRSSLLLTAILALPACASLAPDGGMSLPAEIAARHLRKDIAVTRSEDEAAAVRARVASLLRKPLSADAAVQLALLNNRGLQAAYNALGIADAVRVQQSLPPRPSFELTRLSGAAEVELERQIVGNILALATLPARTEIANIRFRQAQLTAALETLRTAAEARRAYYRAVAAQQVVKLFKDAGGVSATSTELSRRMGDSGAMSKLDQSRQQVLHAELSADLTRAELRASSERERLIRVLGLAEDRLALKLPAALPPLPARPPTLQAAEQNALDGRVDLQTARLDVEALAKSYGLTKATRFVNVLEAGYADKITDSRETGEHAHSRGFTVKFEVPLFDFGEARTREAEQSYMQAVNRLAQKAVDVRSQAREAYRAYRLNYDLAQRYAREVVPLRKAMSQEQMLRYGAMQIDVFTLLTDIRQQIASRVTATEVQRDFWLASTELSAALIGGNSSNADVASAGAPAGGDGEEH
ncbi:MAG: TolC family protein [Proteobacteria bacterium]|nr:TolC family protein [Pseudomonadota bacterium]